MGQFGQQLRQERESRGIALENITGETKISGRHLLALEDENFEALPGGVLSKGIVRGYARVVGLDEDAWVHRYLAAYTHSGHIKDDDVSWMEFAENVGRARKGDLKDHTRGMRWAGVAVLLTLLVLFSLYVAHFVNTRAALAAEDLRPHVAALPVPAMAQLAPPHRARRSLLLNQEQPASAGAGSSASQLPATAAPGDAGTAASSDPPATSSSTSDSATAAAAVAGTQPD